MLSLPAIWQAVASILQAASKCADHDDSSFIGVWPVRGEGYSGVRSICVDVCVEVEIAAEIAIELIRQLHLRR